MILTLALSLALQQTTTCNTAFGTTTCRTTQPPPLIQPDPNAFARGMADGQAAMDRAAAAAREARAASESAYRELGYYPECASRFYALRGCSRAAHDEAVAGQAAREARPALERRVNQALANGDCTGAVRIALEGNDRALAREAREFCEP